ncbi:penicillin-binding protein activator [Roseovarius sp. MMSF_3281]|uniref:penicillin-binding protein activator n=1 Tax=Roseovarius sp. MMSF_3281 TaxID=3046694 RepID=UPI00273F48EA|nr:penicillin-binding protein activator [Roseovarius sp. MMSF_3281]
MFAVLSPARKALSRLMVLFSLVWLAACQPASLSGPAGGGASVGSTKPVPVALLVPHGAASPQEQQLARDLEAAARLAAADLQGVQIDLRVYGTAGSPAQARTAALNAVSDGARIILGPLHAESANAAAVAVASQGVNVLAFSNNATISGGNLFILGQTFNTTANRLARFAARQGKKRILAVYSDNLAGQLGRDAIEQGVNASGAQFAGSVGYEFSQQGVASAVPRIRAKAAQSNADAIFMTSNTAGALPLFSQMLPEAGLSPANTQYIGLARWDVPAQTTALPGVQGGWFAIPDPQRSAAYKSRFQAANGNAPHVISGLAYDGIAAIGALAKSGGRDALSRTRLTQSAGFQGVSGVFRFRPDGTNERGLAVATIRDQKVVVIDPAPQGFGGTGF